MQIAVDNAGRDWPAVSSRDKQIPGGVDKPHVRDRTLVVGYRGCRSIENGEKYGDIVSIILSERFCFR